jgi:NitT/TauT family transport system permease protein
MTINVTPRTLAPVASQDFPGGSQKKRTRPRSKPSGGAMRATLIPARHYPWAVPLGWLALGALIFGTWELLAGNGTLNPVYISQPSKILTAFFASFSTDLLTVHAVSTFTGAIAGWALASVTGVIAALLLASSPFMLRVIEPYLTAVNALPRVALAPIFLLWFGIGLESKIALAFSLAFFVVFSNTLAGVQSADADRLLLARVLGAKKLQTFTKFVLPGAIPGIFTGLELGFIFGMLATVAGEMIAGQSGLGVQLQYFASAFRMDQYFATLIILVAGTMLISWALRLARRKLLRWQSA